MEPLELCVRSFEPNRCIHIEAGVDAGSEGCLARVGQLQYTGATTSSFILTCPSITDARVSNSG
jgi:hypothetical protein